MPAFTTRQGSGGVQGIAFAATTKPIFINTTSGDSKSAWFQAIASTDFDSSFISIWVDTQNLTDDFLVDVGIGAASSEVVLLENLMCYLDADVSHFFNFPIHIPQGTRIAVRGQAADGNNPEVGINLFAQNFMQGGALGFQNTYGENTADSGGTGIDPGTTANTKGSWTEIVASSDELHGFGLGFTRRNDSNMSNGEWAIDIGVGAASSEVIIVPDIFTASNTDEFVSSPQHFFPVHIPSGTRISARCRSNLTSSDRLVDVTIHGVG